MYTKGYLKKIPTNQPKNLPSEIIRMGSLEYLYRQNQMTFDQEYVSANIDDGINGEAEDSRVEDECVPEEIPLPDDPDEIDDSQQEDQVPQESTDAKGISGWKKVGVLARALINLKGISIIDNGRRR